MRVFHRIEEVYSSLGRSAVALGNFDGVHSGHVALIRDMMKIAKDQGTTPSVLTFFPHPVEVIYPGKKLERLTTATEKLRLLEKLGVETVLVAKFDVELASLSPAVFFERYLKNGFKAGSVHVGFNFCFGKARAGNTDILAELCGKSHIRLQIEPAVKINDQKVSSSSIRETIREGRVKDAAECLGRFYSLNGQICHGEGRGNQLGFPTANLRVPSDKMLPKNGVYITRAWWQQQSFFSVTNIGVRPTFANPADLSPHVEAHLFDFSSRIYDEQIELEFLDRLRDEVKFSSLEGLKEQIGKDISAARKYCGGFDVSRQPRP